jgi:hypothetical protein
MPNPFGDKIECVYKFPLQYRNWVNTERVAAKDCSKIEGSEERKAVCDKIHGAISSVYETSGEEKGLQELIARAKTEYLKDCGAYRKSISQRVSKINGINKLMFKNSAKIKRNMTMLRIKNELLAKDAEKIKGYSDQLQSNQAQNKLKERDKVTIGLPYWPWFQVSTRTYINILIGVCLLVIAFIVYYCFFRKMASTAPLAAAAAAAAADVDAEAVPPLEPKEGAAPEDAGDQNDDDYETED